MISPGTEGVEISICIPAHARPAELRAAIRSVLGQSFPVSEVLIGDDSGELVRTVEEFNDPRVIYIRNDRQLGMANNWNSLLDQARGRYLGLLMDDDVLAPTFVEKCLEGLSSLEVGISFTNHAFFDDGGRRWIRQCALSAGLHRAFLVKLLELRPVAVSAAIMRREVWNQVRPLPDILTADLYMHAQAAAAGWSFFYVDEPLMSYRVHSGQLSQSKTKFRDDGVRLWELLKFESADAEAIRKRALARALVSRAAARLQLGEANAARRDLRRAQRTSIVSTLTARGIAITIVSMLPSRLHKLILGILKGRRWLETVR
jgi:glycosyltransferase involved in cell wall biosynthesis